MEIVLSGFNEHHFQVSVGGYISYIPDVPKRWVMTKFTNSCEFIPKRWVMFN